MSALIFPTSPTIGDRWPLNPGTAGVTQYVWSGTSWDIVPSSVSIGPTNQLAFNNYVWPLTDGASGDALVTDGAGSLSWSASTGGIAWTAKGELVAATGPGADAFVSVGANTSFLVANSATATGLAYTDSLTSAVLLPSGNGSSQRPTLPILGQVRYNNTANEFEGYSGSPAAWQTLGGQPTGGGSDKIFFTNSQVVTTNYTLPAGKNAMSSGPVTINSGVTVTIPAGASWAVV
jgi:hypothetical protein